MITQLDPRRGAPFSIRIERRGRTAREREGFSPSEQSAIAEGIARLAGD